MRIVFWPYKSFSKASRLRTVWWGFDSKLLKKLLTLTTCSFASLVLEHITRIISRIFNMFPFIDNVAQDSATTANQLTRHFDVYNWWISRLGIIQYLRGQKEGEGVSRKSTLGHVTNIGIVKCPQLSTGGGGGQNWGKFGQRTFWRTPYTFLTSSSTRLLSGL